MGAPDWKRHLASARPDRPVMTHDSNVTDGQTLTLGDTTARLALTPGHTPGTIAMLLPVKHQGRTHTALLMSGTQMPAHQSLAAFEHVFDDFAKKQHAEAALGSHPGTLLSLETLEALGRAYPSGPHPLLYGPQRFARYLDSILECGRARLTALETTPS